MLFRRTCASPPRFCAAPFRPPNSFQHGFGHAVCLSNLDCGPQKNTATVSPTLVNRIQPRRIALARGQRTYDATTRENFKCDRAIFLSRSSGNAPGLQFGAGSDARRVVQMPDHARRKHNARWHDSAGKALTGTGRRARVSAADGPLILRSKRRSPPDPRRARSE